MKNEETAARIIGHKIAAADLFAAADAILHEFRGSTEYNTFARPLADKLYAAAKFAEAKNADSTKDRMEFERQALALCD